LIIEFFPEEFIESIYLSNLNMTPFNLKIVFIISVTLLRSLKIIKSLPVIILLLRPSLNESLLKLCKFLEFALISDKF
jgi:hypothetical protein